MCVRIGGGESCARRRQLKRAHKDNEALCNELVGQAHVEQCALRLFATADLEDRAGRFGKWVWLGGLPQRPHPRRAGTW